MRQREVMRGEGAWFYGAWFLPLLTGKKGGAGEVKAPATCMQVFVYAF